MASEQTTRLDSWKEIAAYLGRDITTVIRWEKEKGLPVHRLPGGKRQAVFALRREIDAWLTGHPSDPSSQASETRALPALSQLRFWVAPILATAVVLTITAIVVMRTGKAEDGSVEKAGGSAAAHPSQPVGPLIPSFNRSDIAVPSAYTLALGDLNRNGEPDFVVTGYRSNSLYVFVGTGGGAFAGREHSLTALKPDGVTLADFDGDGNLDAITGNRGSDSVSLLRGDGDGAFRPHVDIPVAKGPRGLAAGDFDGDGRGDLAVANSDSDSVSIFLGEKETLRHKADYPVRHKPYQLRVADFNADGKLDLVVGATNEGKVGPAPLPALFILLGIGNGAFRPHAGYVVGRGSSGIAVADLNGDGKLDLAVTDFESNACWLLAGRGDGAFQQPSKLPAAPAPLDIAAADIDGDGKLDLIVANAHAKSVSVFRGFGDGTFAAKLDYPVHSYPKSLAVADLDADGFPDILVTNFLDNSVSVLLNTTRK